MSPFEQSEATGLGRQERVLLDRFHSEEKAAVSAVDVEEVLSVNRAHASRMLSRLAAKGWLVRLRRGLYAPVPLGSPSAEASVQDAWAVAMSLFAPCMISGWSAAEHWSLTEQIFNSVAVVTTRPQRTRTHEVAGFVFRCRQAEPERFFGAKRIWSGSIPVQMADPHRMVIDILDSPEFGGGARHALDVVRAYWQSSHAEAKRVLQYAKQYGKGVVFKRLGFCAELWGEPSDAWLVECRANLSAGIALLDPHGPQRGRIDTRWRLRINVPIGESI